MPQDDPNPLPVALRAEQITEADFDVLCRLAAEPTEPAPTPRNDATAFAAELSRAYHTRCFWHSPRDLDITPDLIPFVVKGLQSHGGHEGWHAAAWLLQLAATAPRGKRIRVKVRQAGPIEPGPVDEADHAAGELGDAFP
jgi:hypothetical protein